MDGNKIGRYILRSEIGRGGMATVYLAYDPQFDRQVAIKALPREFLHDPTFQARFERETQTIAKLEHPAIVPVYDSGEEDGQPYLVLRYMAGGSLAERIQLREALSIDEVIRILSTIASALEKAHSQGIIHRDLKPSNILFDEDGNPYLADFGIAKLAEGGGTLTGSRIIGTPAYMSPEQAQGEGELDHKSDIYSLGVILYEMLSGVQPYIADTPIRLALKHVTDPVPQIHDVKSDLPPQIQDVLARVLSKNPTERFSSASALAKAFLQAAAGQLKLPPVQEDLTYDDLRETREPRFRKKTSLFASMSRWLLLGLIVVGAMVVGLVLGLQDESGVVASRPTATVIEESDNNISPASPEETTGLTNTPGPVPSATYTAGPTLTATVETLTQMPDVIGLNLEEVVEVLANTIIPVDYRFNLDNDVTPGTVIDQMPIAGEDLSGTEYIEVSMAYGLESVFSASETCPRSFFASTSYRVELEAGETYQASVFSGAPQAEPTILLNPLGSAGDFHGIEPVSQSGENFRTYYIDETATYILLIGADNDNYDCIVNVSRQIFPDNMDLLEAVSTSDQVEPTTASVVQYVLTVRNTMSDFLVGFTFLDSNGVQVGNFGLSPKQTKTITLPIGTYTVTWGISNIDPNGDGRDQDSGSTTIYIGADTTWVIKSVDSLNQFP